MKINIITKENKWLNASSYVSLAFGTISIICTAKIASGIRASITMGLVALGLICMLISWGVRKWNKININIEDISMLTVNSESDSLNKIQVEELDYLGHWLTLRNGRKYEIERIHILELTLKLNAERIETKKSKDTFYNAAPIEVIKELLKLGP